MTSVNDEKIPGESDGPSLPNHVSDSVQTILRMHEAHEHKASRGQRIVEGTTRRVGQPAVILAILTLLLSWMAGNAIAAIFHRAPLDPPPFVFLELAASLAALLMTALVLTTQRRADRLADERARLTLELALLGEHKTAKIIELLESLRRDHPDIADRSDAEATAMSTPADADVVLGVIRGD
jgi:uncharacterized membrane protein